jgi:hypothetical protein
MGALAWVALSIAALATLFVTALVCAARISLESIHDELAESSSDLRQSREFVNRCQAAGGLR